MKRIGEKPKDVADIYKDVVNKLSSSYNVWADKTGVVEFSKIRPVNEAIPGAVSKN